MKEGNSHINITYVVGIALSNHNHSHIYESKKEIEIPTIFEDINTIESPRKQFLEEVEERVKWKLARELKIFEGSSTSTPKLHEIKDNLQVSKHIGRPKLVWKNH